MRVDDLPAPTVPAHPHPSPSWLRGRLVVGLERLPQAAYVWDDTDPNVVWDRADLEQVWDAPFVAEGFSDAWCDLVAGDVTIGGADPYEGYLTNYCRLVLRDPGDGRYVARTADGRLVYYAAGRRVALYWLDDDLEPWWVFSGSVATWRTQLDGTVVVEAYSGMADLNRSLGRPWTAGTAGQLPAQRLTAILTAADYIGPTRFDLGDVPLSVPAPGADLPIDAARRVAASDGGLLYSDTDDTLVLRDRRWRNGRTDQDTVPVFTDNICQDGAVVGWEPRTADTDLRLAGTVALTNDADPPLTAVAVTAGTDPDPRIVWSHVTTDLWETQQDGDVLAAHQLAVRVDARLALGQFLVHLHDRRFDYWSDVVDRRLGDRVQWIHRDTYTDPDREELYDLELVVTALSHTITPEAWTVNVVTSPAVDYTAVEMWDVTGLVWDDPNPLAVWR